MNLTNAKRVRLALGAAMVLGLVAVGAREAAASIFIFSHGSSCYGVNTNGVPNPAGPGLVIDQFGIHNSSGTSSANIVCPVNAATSTNFGITGVTAVVWQENGSGLSCTFLLTDASGGVVWSGTQTAPSTTTAHSQNLSWTPSGSAENGLLECTLPAGSPSFFAFNYLSSFWVNSN